MTECRGSASDDNDVLVSEDADGGDESVSLATDRLIVWSRPSSVLN